MPKLLRNNRKAYRYKQRDRVIKKKKLVRKKWTANSSQNSLIAKVVQTDRISKSKNKVKTITTALSKTKKKSKWNSKSKLKLQPNQNKSVREKESEAAILKINHNNRLLLLTGNPSKRERNSTMKRINKHLLPRSAKEITALKNTKRQKLMHTQNILRLDLQSNNHSKSTSQLSSFNTNVDESEIIPMDVIDNSNCKWIAKQKKLHILSQKHLENNFNSDENESANANTNTNANGFGNGSENGDRDQFQQQNDVDVVNNVSENEDLDAFANELQLQALVDNVANSDSNSSPESHASFAKISNLPNTYTPGTMVVLPQRINGRWWKVPPNTHGSKYIEFNPKSRTFSESMFNKKNQSEMKDIENRLREEIREEKHLAKLKRDQRLKIREENIRKGMIVKPIRNIHKLRNFTKKQWRSVMKASVELNNKKISLRAGFMNTV